MPLAHQSLSEDRPGIIQRPAFLTTIARSLADDGCLRRLILRRFALIGLPVLATACSVAGAQDLKVTYGSKGIQTLSFAGTTLEDVSAFPADSFHIHHMKCEDLAGNALTSGQYGWGENNNGTSWNPSTRTETYTYSWGSITVQFVQNGNNLDLVVTETNSSNSGVKFDGAEIFPLALHFPRDPKGFNGYSQFLNTTTGPAVSVADFGSGIVTAVLPDESIPMHGGWKNMAANTYSPLLTTTSPDGLATFLPHTDNPLAPGTSIRYTLSLRFTASGAAADATDAYRSFASTYPSQMTWSDHRILGTAFLASSPANQGDKTQPGGFPTNPRRYFNDPSTNVTIPTGLQNFQNRMLAQATSNVTNTRSMNGQGVITWDLEGEQYPHDVSYVCSPEQIGTVAPEMESAVLNKQSPYFGMKLDDAYFKTMTDAGLRVGLCIRPQLFTLNSNGSASQNFLPTNSAIISNLEKKITFASSRWGVTVFYVDSTVDSIGKTLDPAIFQRLITDFPSFLFIPEEATPRYYAYSAPFYSFIFHGTTGTDASVYQYYPKAFGVNLVNDVATATLQAAIPALTQAVSKGDILMGHADYWQANDPLLVQIYQAAGAASLPRLQVKPSISWNTPASIPYGTPLTSTQLNASASAAGTFTYNPGPRSVLSGGVNTLMTTFTPTEAQDYTSATAATTLIVTPATPTLSWRQPDVITYGTPLSGVQLSAASNVPGTFTFSPAIGTVLPAGTTPLVANFTPGNTSNYGTAQTSTTITVARATPKITWNPPASVVQGIRLGPTQLNAVANIPGTFTYSPPLGSPLSAGTANLNATFTPADTANYNSATASVALTVTSSGARTPVATWSTPAPIVYGTPLSSQQLNASFSAPGTIAYTPSFNTVSAAGTVTLQARFTPADTNAYQSSTASVQLTVLKSQPTITWPVPATLESGMPLTPAHLNASASVPGTFQYLPAAGAILPAGTQTLVTQFTPTDSNNYSSKSAAMNILVSQPQPAPALNSNLYVVSPEAGNQVSGVINVSAVCRLTLDPAGTYLMVDGRQVGTRRVVDGPYFYPLDTRNLSNGVHTLQIWGHDIGDRVTISSAISIVVAN